MQKSLSRLGWSKRAGVTCHTGAGEGNYLRRNTSTSLHVHHTSVSGFEGEGSPTILHDFPRRKVVGPGYQLKILS